MPYSRVLLFALLMLLPLQAAASPLVDDVRREISALLREGGRPAELQLGAPVQFSSGFPEAFYLRRDFAPGWIGNLGPNPMAFQLIELLRSSGEQGLCSDDYHLLEIEPLLRLAADSLRHGVLFDPHYLAILDLLLSDAYVRYAVDLSGTGEEDDPKREEARRNRLVRGLEQSLVRQQVGRQLAGLLPVQPGYRALAAELDRLRELSAFGGWPEVPAGPLLHPGEADDRLALIKVRLFLSGDLTDGQAWRESVFGPLTRDGLKSFQERHGLDRDGVLGPATLAELNVPVEARIRQLELNLERWRHLPEDLGLRHIRVNIADFRLEVYDHGQPVLTMPVVVGTPYRQTPVFSAQMSYIEFAPYWKVPETILREDKLPLIRRDPGWLTRNHYEILPWLDSGEMRLEPREIDWRRIDSSNFPGTLRMLPGPWNPLGRVKFIFPNRYAVYLHDTNEQALFDRDQRLFSSGCIRIERPLDLAQYLLEGVDGWTCSRILDAMEGGEPLQVELPQKLPVHLVYLTAWVDHAARLQFRPDVYLRDAGMELARQRFGPAASAGDGLVRADFSASEKPQ